MGRRATKKNHFVTVWLRSFVRNSCFNVGSPRVAIILWKGPAELMKFCKGVRAARNIEIRCTIPTSDSFGCYVHLLQPVLNSGFRISESASRTKRISVHTPRKKIF